jgi:hypothetical protein
MINCTKEELEEKLKGIELIDGMRITDIHSSCGENLIAHLDDGRTFSLSPSEVLKMVNEFEFNPSKRLKHIPSLVVMLKEGDYYE